MRMVTLAIATLLSLGAMFWAAAVNSSQMAADDENALIPAEGVGLGLALLFALGALCALHVPHLAMALFALAGLLAIAAGVLVEVAELLALGAVAAVPALTSIISARQSG